MKTEVFSPHILCVSWDPALARTREILLTEHGYTVTSALGLEESRERCKTKAHLLLLGHSVPRIEKQHILDCFRQFNNAPTLSLVAPGQQKLPDVDYAVETFNPEQLVTTIREIVSSHRT
jgi:DNA-binding response OmpR family regulator